MPSKELKKYSELDKELSIDDEAAVLHMTTIILENLGGRPCIYPDTEEGLKTFIENSKGYFSYLESANNKLEERQQIIPDIEGYCLWLGIERTTLSRYRKRDSEWGEVINLFKNAIAVSKKQLALKGKIPSVLAVFDLVNNHDYFNTNSFTLECSDIPKKSDMDFEAIKAYRLPILKSDPEKNDEDSNLQM